MLQHVHHSAGLNAPARTLGLQYERLRVVFLCAVDRCDRPFPLLGGSGTVSMETTLRLRAKDYAAHDRWLVNLQDVITSNRLDDLWENQQVPTLEAVQRQFTKET